MVGSTPSRALFVSFVLVLVAVVLSVGGCGGGDTYSYDRGELAKRFLPTERTVAYPPDSLGALSITKEKGTYKFELENDYEALHRRWSCTYQELGAGRSQRGRSYATFWSLELSLASLQPEMGITSLSQEQAQKEFQRRRQEHYSTIQVDVYWFEAEGSSILTGPSTRVKLRVEEETYQPAKENHGPLREVFLPDRAQTTLYRRNTFYFSRIVDSTDILKDAQGIELRIDRTGIGSGTRFAWSWETESQARAHPRDRRLPQFLRAAGRIPRDSDEPVPARRMALPDVNH